MFLKVYRKQVSSRYNDTCFAFVVKSIEMDEALILFALYIPRAISFYLLPKHDHTSMRRGVFLKITKNYLYLY